MAPSDAISLLSFAPGDTLAEAILIDLSSPHASLSSVAAKHHIPLATLSLWLTKPETQALLHAIESGGYAHTRLAAALNLSTTVPVLLQILSDFRSLAATTTDLTSPTYQRASVSARKAAWMLLRLARSHPLTPAQLSAARDTLGATRAAAPRHDTAPRANLITTNPIASHTSQPNAPARHSHRDTQPREERTSRTSIATPNHTATTSTITTAPTNSTQPAPTHAARAEPAPSTTAEPQPTTSPTRLSTPPGDLSDLVSHLSSIAESLGIDISDLDEMADNMLHHATGPPHEATVR